VRRTRDLIFAKTKLFKLGHCHRKNLLNFAQTGIPHSILGSSQTIEKALPKGILLQASATDAISELQQLRH
jgi:hypothetical protein